MRLGILATLLAATLGYSSGKAMAGERPVAPAWELKSPSGQTVRLSDFKGKVVVLNFWATWCGPCRREIPDLVKLQKALGPAGVVVVGLSVDTESAKYVGADATKLGVTYPVAMADPLTIFRYGDIQYIPTTFIIDRTGRVASMHTAPVDDKTLEAELKPLL